MVKEPIKLRCTPLAQFFKILLEKLISMKEYQSKFKNKGYKKNNCKK